MDYAHARHAGNLGDVLKHVALAAVCQELSGSCPLYLETHAGDGLYRLGAVGEWGEGVARFADLPDRAGPLGAWRKAIAWREGAQRPDAYPGSPVLARKLLPAARMELFEIDSQSRQVLQAALGADERVRVHGEDGFAGALREAKGPALVLIDPPYSEKSEWLQVARTVPALPAEAAVLLWYPIKAMTRPQALLGQLAEAGVRGTAIELIGTPLRLKREKLNGCGVVFIRCPQRAIDALAADLPELGARLQTRGEWTCRLLGF